jgi:tetratricopeptide (TPR) repeat protein
MAFLRANQAASRGEVAEAERAYRELAARPELSEHARVVEALVGLLASKKDYAACAELAVAEAPRLAPGTSRATLLATGLSCARDGKRGTEMQTLAAAAERAATDTDPRMIDDDRSALFEELVETKKEQGDDAAAKAMARTWATFLEQAAARAPTREAKAVFDPHRLSAYLAAGEPERAVPMLLESERAFPDDYNPPARLARAYLTMKRLDDAQAAIDRAAARVYGPRSLRVFGLAADIAKARSDVASERRALEQALGRTTHAVLNENQKKLRAELAVRLSGLAK